MADKNLSHECLYLVSLDNFALSTGYMRQLVRLQEWIPRRQ